MGIYQYAIENNQNFVIWGCGNYLNQVIDKIDPNINILFVCDNDEKKWGTLVTNRKFKCNTPDVLRVFSNIVILIAIKSKKLIKEVQKEIRMLNIPCCHINEALLTYREKYEKVQINKYNSTIALLDEPNNLNILKYFITVSVPVQACQLKCEYCYIGQNGGFENDDIVLPSAEFIRKSLSRKRLGGSALINICGVGETLLFKELFSIIEELLKEGHYISIITNALLTEEIERYLSLPLELRKKIFFKCSFHYRQLKEKNILELYAKNVNKIWYSGASISVELVPEDELISQIYDIKKFCIKNFGALPHVTVARDESKSEMPIITKFSFEKYKEIWGQFDSSMFWFKLNHMDKRTEYCSAGKNTFLLSLESGNISPCPNQNSFFNIYDDISQKIKFKEVGFSCTDTYCRNAHAYLSLGMIKEINDSSYLKIRDRTTIFGKNWINKDMANIFDQRICDNY